jgi:hypothetical protein
MPHTLLWDVECYMELQNQVIILLRQDLDTYSKNSLIRGLWGPKVTSAN